MPKKIAVLGAGGLGKAAALVVAQKEEFQLVGACDSMGFCYREDGIDVERLAAVEQSVAELPGGVESNDSLFALFEAGPIDGAFVALPNLPNEFIPEAMAGLWKRGISCCFADALKRTGAMRLMFAKDEAAKAARSVYLTGCGATPGLLSAAAVVAAQSFAKVEHVDIHWGVGIGNWDQYRATVREDIAHLPGFDLEKAKAMTDEEVESFLQERNWRLEFHGMEHADDLLLQRAGVVDDLDQVSVGGVLQIKTDKKPVSTTMTLTGITFEGKRSSHKFVLGDETSMAANVIGTALGYLKRAFWLKDRGIYGVFGSTEFMPMFPR